MTRPKSARCVVVDTNVLAVAEGLHPDASDECRAACTKLARQIEAGLVVVTDSEASGRVVLQEYLKRLRHTPTSGVGSKVAKMLWSRQWDEAVCRTVEITGCDDPPGSYSEVPFALRDFDVDDHKWFAVAMAESNTPPIYQALDREWWDRQPDFAANGLDVQFVCSSDLIEAEAAGDA